MSNYKFLIASHKWINKLTSFPTDWTFRSLSKLNTITLSSRQSSWKNVQEGRKCWFSSQTISTNNLQGKISFLHNLEVSRWRALFPKYLIRIRAPHKRLIKEGESWGALEITYKAPWGQKVPNNIRTILITFPLLVEFGFDLERQGCLMVNIWFAIFPRDWAKNKHRQYFFFTPYRVSLFTTTTSHLLIQYETWTTLRTED